MKLMKEMKPMTIRTGYSRSMRAMVLASILAGTVEDGVPRVLRHKEITMKQ